jgi:phosphohistidine phosphatase
VEIYLVRHGIASDPMRAAQLGIPDSDRELTSEGREKTNRVAKAFSKQVTSVQTIVHSPYVRARETAEIFHRYFPDAQIGSGQGLRPHDAVEQGLATIADRIAGNIMVVGHEPHLSALTSLLLTGNPHSSIQFKKAGIAGFEWNGAGDSRLLFLLPPKFLLG